MDTDTDNKDACPAGDVLRALSGQWTADIVHTLGEGGPARFTALQRALGAVTAKVLSQRLRALEGDGFVWREVEATVPPKTTYGLTEEGRAVHDLLRRFDGRGAGD